MVGCALHRRGCTVFGARSRDFLISHQCPRRSRRLNRALRHPSPSELGASKSTFLRSILKTGAAFLSLAAVYSGGPVAMASATEDQAAKVLLNPDWPEELPYTAEDFQRFDESPDGSFYSQPRFVTHIDDQAIRAVTSYYEQVLPMSGRQDAAVLDLCSSWISHYPINYKVGRISGMGMNKEELQRNSALTDFEVKDLNVDAALPYADNTFDVITNVVSVDYLTKPLEVFKEMHRVLKPGGRAIMSFSNRCFPTKAIAVWTRTGDLEHVWIVGSYFHYSLQDGWTNPEAIDLSPKTGLFGRSDPMYVVTATKI